jgi:uncharacterized protein YodC (DUF2158 family)
MPEAINTITTSDVIRLRSGGPKMTPVEFDTNDRGLQTVSCMWFAGDKIEYVTLLLSSVEKVVPLSGDNTIRI